MYSDVTEVQQNLIKELDARFGFRSFIFYVNTNVKYGKLSCRHKSCPTQYWFQYELVEESDPPEVKTIIFDRAINTNHSLKSHNFPLEKEFSKYSSVVQITSERIF